MAAMTTMGLSQHVIGPTDEKGHTLDQVFSTGRRDGGPVCGGFIFEAVVMVGPFPGKV